MIAGLKGIVKCCENKERFTTLEIYTPMGVTYEVLTPNTANMAGVELSTEIDMYTTMVVKEDSQTLYGFVTREEKDLFESLITVSGIGPKTGISILSYYGFNETVNLIVNGDEKGLSKVSGLGLKSAKKIIIELQTKLEGVSLSSSLNNGQISSSTNKSQQIAELEDALSSLGFTGIELKRYVEVARSIIKAEPTISIEILITEVLKK